MRGLYRLSLIFLNVLLENTRVHSANRLDLCLCGLCLSRFRLHSFRLNWLRLDRFGLDWLRLDWFGLDRLGLDWLSLSRLRPNRLKSSTLERVLGFW